jgi:hypothetical protein
MEATHKHYYLELKDILGSEYVLKQMTDFEVIGALIELVNKVNYEDLEGELKEAKDEIAYLEREVDELQDEVIELREELAIAKL